MPARSDLIVSLVVHALQVLTTADRNGVLQLAFRFLSASLNPLTLRPLRRLDLSRFNTASESVRPTGVARSTRGFVDPGQSRL